MGRTNWEHNYHVGVIFTNEVHISVYSENLISKILTNIITFIFLHTVHGLCTVYIGILRWTIMTYWLGRTLEWQDAQVT